MDVADPTAVHTLGDLKREFDRLRRGEGRRQGAGWLSLDALVAPVARHRGKEVPRSTLDNYLSGRTLAPHDVYEAILKTLGVADDKLGPWGDAWDRIDEAKRAPNTDQTDTVTGKGPGPTPEAASPSQDGRRRRLLLILTATCAALVAGVVAVVVTKTVSPPDATEHARAGECSYGLAFRNVAVRPQPKFDRALGMTMMTDNGQTVYGACRPVTGEPGTVTCGVGTVPMNTWLQVRYPHEGWIFMPCLAPRP
ncbi:XRE family transcriptional regulator [Amycolatopsis thailandensis]|uniref:XRE family transcriptional regulator n=1 Tax=Amycolatopsis thailandensis TaxID=589330 RepID=UPI0036666D4C